MMFEITCQRCNKQTQRKTAIAKYCLKCAAIKTQEATKRTNQLALSERHSAKYSAVKSIEEICNNLAKPGTDERSFLNEIIGVNMPILLGLDSRTIGNYLEEEIYNYNEESPVMIGLCRICKFKDGIRTCDSNHSFRVLKKIDSRTSEKRKQTNKDYTKRYLSAVRTKTEMPTWTVSEVKKRDNNTCQICLLPIPANTKNFKELSLNIDHIIPISSGGNNDFSNVQATHSKCNSWKSATVDYKHSAQRQEYMVKLLKMYNS